MKLPGKIFLAAIWIISLGFKIQAQSTSPEVISNSGNHFTGTNAQVQWTLGETVIETQSAGNNTLTQGFHQTQLTVTALEEPVAEMGIKVFPNPTSETLRTEWSNSSKALDIRFIDMYGRVLWERKSVLGGNTSIDVSRFTQGDYILQVSDPASNSSQPFKVQIIR